MSTVMLILASGVIVRNDSMLHKRLQTKPLAHPGDVQDYTLSQTPGTRAVFSIPGVPGLQYRVATRQPSRPAH